MCTKSDILSWQPESLDSHPQIGLVECLSKHWYGNIPDLPLLRYMCQVVIRKTQSKELGFRVHGGSLWTPDGYTIYTPYVPNKKMLWIILKKVRSWQYPAAGGVHNKWPILDQKKNPKNPANFWKLLPIFDDGNLYSVSLNLLPDFFSFFFWVQFSGHFQAFWLFHFFEIHPKPLHSDRTHPIYHPTPSPPRAGTWGGTTAVPPHPRAYTISTLL